MLELRWDDRDIAGAVAHLDSLRGIRCERVPSDKHIAQTHTPFEPLLSPNYYPNPSRVVHEIVLDGPSNRLEVHGAA